MHDQFPRIVGGCRPKGQPRLPGQGEHSSPLRYLKAPRWKSNFPAGGFVIPLEAPTGFEPVVKVLQTFALPLGHGAEPTLLIT